MKRKILSGLATALLFVLPGAAHAGFIPDRNTLNAILGPSGVTDTFASPALAQNPNGPGHDPNFLNALPLKDDPSATKISSLDNSTSFTLNNNFNQNGKLVLAKGTYGPGLVNKGVTYQSVDDGSGNIRQLQLNGLGDGGLPNSIGQSLQSRFTKNIKITFNPGVAAFGVDLIAFANNTQKADVTIYGTDGVTILAQETVDMSQTDPNGPVPVFVGYQGDNGTRIGSVVLATNDFYENNIDFSPNIDNVQFGSPAVPEPASLMLLGTAAAGFLVFRWRRRK